MQYYDFRMPPAAKTMNQEDPMNVIDMHCDTIARLYSENNSASLRHNSFHIDLEKLQKGGYLLQNFALFVDQRETNHPLETGLALADLYDRELVKNQDLIAPVLFREDIRENEKNGKLSALLTLEEGEILNGSLANLRIFYRLGVRMIALTWNYDNQIGSPNLQFDEQGEPLFSARSRQGLTDFGIELIREMERLGILIDVSHLSDGGFYDVLKHTSAPFVASHSNAAAVCNVCRNLTDDMIRALAERGGVMGLNFCTDFLREPTRETHTAMGGTITAASMPVSTISQMVRHLRHISNTGGIEVCALGSDFDGISNGVEFTDASGIQALADALSVNGFSTSDIEKIFYQNVLRVYHDVLPGRS